MSEPTPTSHDERAIFEAMIDLPPAQRDAALRERCNGDTALRNRLSNLLAAHDRADNFVRTPPPVRRVVEIDAADTALHGRMIGRYRIIDTIAAGGMGVVYRARRDDADDIVALKVIRPGLARGSLLKRFEHEAIVLGQLNHPGIARVLEAGTFDLGVGPQPYFAMEFIDGERLSVFAANHRLSVAHKVELLAAVCDAVQHAHSKGVIHRDLKPDNILVQERGIETSRHQGIEDSTSLMPRSLDALMPSPKIVDFGVARVTDADLAVTTIQTGLGQLIGTLPYMSPEQVAGDASRIDTRSDVYALGVILYELLGSRLPHELGRHSVIEAARIIIHDEPTRLSSIDRVLKGDLDTIVAKAMEKDPARRYQSAGELAADLRRHMHDEPILARPATTMYQLRKFARRNRGLVIGAAAVLLMLVLGVAGTTIGLVRANFSAKEARDQEQSARLAAEEAQKQREGAERVSTFLQQMLATADPQITRGRDVSLMTMLGEAVTHLDTGALHDQPEVEARVRTTVADAYQSLGHYGPAEAQYEAALKITRVLRGDDDPVTAEAMILLAGLLGRNEKIERGLELVAQAIDIFTRLHGPDDLTTIRAERSRASLVSLTGNQPEGRRLHEELLPRAIRACGTEQTELVADIKVGLAYICHEDTLAERLLLEALDTYRGLFGPDHDKVARALTNLGSIQSNSSQFEQAVRTTQESVAIRERLFGPDHPSLAPCLYNIGNFLHNLKKYDEAIAHYERALRIQNDRLVPGHWTTIRTEYRLGRTLCTLKRFDEAEPHLRIAATGVVDFPGRALIYAEHQRMHGVALTELKRFDEAHATLMAAIELAGRPEFEGGFMVTRIARDLQRLFTAWSKPEEASHWRLQYEQRRAAEQAAAATSAPAAPTS